MTIHFVYIKGDSISTPNAITNEVSRRLANFYPVKVYDWNDPVVITPKPGDILIGHPTRDSEQTVFNMSLKQPGWARTIVFSPFAHAMLEYNGYTDPFVMAADLYLAICGRYWFDTNESSAASHWHYKMIHCDLGVNREHFPHVKKSFNPAGRRRFLFIGRTMPSKGVDFLCRIAEANPTIDFGWIGQGEVPSKRIVPHGRHDFKNPASLQLAASYDFLITCGRSDANPTTILEASAWGLIPVATLQSGYYGNDWLVNIPLDDVAGASSIINDLNSCPESDLLARQQAGFRELDSHYNWDRVVRQICEAIQMPIPAEPTDPAWRRRKLRNQAEIQRILRRDQMREQWRFLKALPGRAVRKALKLAGLRKPS